MRDILSKVMTGSMIAGAALLVTACGGGGEANNAAADNSLDVYSTNDIGTDLGNTGDLGNVGTGNMSNDLSNASNAVDNAASAIDNAQSNAGQ